MTDELAVAVSRFHTMLEDKLARIEAKLGDLGVELQIIRELMEDDAEEVS